MYPEEWRQTLTDSPHQGVTRSVSPSQPDSPAKQMRTSLMTYTTPVPSPLTQLPNVGPSTMQVAAPPPLDPILGLETLDPNILGCDMFPMPIRRSTSLPLTTIVPPEPPFDVDAPPEPEFDAHSVKSTDFIRSMYIWDDPGTTQPEDVALFLYLAGTSPY